MLRFWVGASAENGGDLPNEPVHSRQLGWIVWLKFERYFPYSYKIPSPHFKENLGHYRSSSRNIRAGYGATGNYRKNSCVIFDTKIVQNAKARNTKYKTRRENKVKIKKTQKLKFFLPRLCKIQSLIFPNLASAAMKASVKICVHKNTKYNKRNKKFQHERV